MTVKATFHFTIFSEMRKHFARNTSYFFTAHALSFSQRNIFLPWAKKFSWTGFNFFHFERKKYVINTTDQSDFVVKPWPQTYKQNGGSQWQQSSTSAFYLSGNEWREKIYFARNFFAYRWKLWSGKSPLAIDVK